jgi:transcriptional regulator with XRE-family HTH domain
MEEDMINRLKEIMDYFKLSPSKLADELSINRSRLSHILNGRNNPTLEVVQGILTKYNALNPEWVLFGTGSMIKTGVETDPNDLFQFAEINKKKKQPAVDKTNTETSVIQEIEEVLKTDKVELPGMATPEVRVKNKELKGNGAIKRITVYFSNNEYQDFISE